MNVASNRDPHLSHPDQTHADQPVGNASGFKRYFKDDLVAGFLVFLIALPLCLGISLACGFPPIAGVFTAVIGSVLSTFISNSELTIKGPAAGLIVIVVGCVEDFGGNAFFGGTPADISAYQATLAIGVAAAVLQIAFGFCRAGILGEFFPLAAVHGMLAAIGVIIMIKQFPVVLGGKGTGGPLAMIGQFPQYLSGAVYPIALIGITSLAVMFLVPWIGRRVRWLRRIPAPVIVLLVAVPMGMQFDLTRDHTVTMGGKDFDVGSQHLVEMPQEVLGMFRSVAFPDFSALGEVKAWKWVMMFFVIGSLESLLSAKAVDLLDPFKRKSDMDRDMIAVGTGNLCASMVGGLPMISEIVRSKANIDNGAKTRFADLWHGVFLLLCVALIPMYLHLIPLAALAAMLMYTGFRLAHPSEFAHMYHIGREQLVIFVVTLVAVLATDLLVGIFIGIALKMTIHVRNGATLRSLFVPRVDSVQTPGDAPNRLTVHEAAVFSNWLSFKRRIEALGIDQGQDVTVDVSDASLIDHSTMEKLEQLQEDFARAGHSLTIEGLENLQAFTADHHAARKRVSR